MDITLKKCIKCFEEKERSEFHKHPKMADGLISKCRKCASRLESERQYRLRSDPEYVRVYNLKLRERNKVKQYSSKKGKSLSPKERVAKLEIYHNKYPEKKLANHSNRNLRRKMKLTGTNIILHHWSYQTEHIKDVIILSKSDHTYIHRFMEYDKSTFMYTVKSGNVLLYTRKLHEEYINYILNTRRNEKQ